MECPNVFPLRILSRKWSYFILRALHRPKGFSDLHRELRFVTNRMLSRELKLLEKDGLVKGENGYALTPAGKELLAALTPLAAWSQKHKDCTDCPTDRPCSACQNYPVVVGARAFPATKP